MQALVLYALAVPRRRVHSIWVLLCSYLGRSRLQHQKLPQELQRQWRLCRRNVQVHKRLLRS